ncbi:COG3772 Phage-related lysozyme (muraminidase) [uncultured Caudovirales phage]|uniref:Endolysin n=1 Tax=uncultured Caudovirales phage TaxID=2100421 RepID=A0A6J7W8D3_9CAUD|nr:COG3772 Phage-related lysozyme (muraminidase) [uncultured Caudovirales phage]
MATKSRVAVASLALSASALVGIAVNEGYIGQAYKDVVGVPTIGFGETQGVTPGQKTDPVRALVKLEASASSIAQAMAACIQVPISQNEYDAYVSFSYNLGPGTFCKYIAPVLNKPDYEGACKKILLFDHAGGKKYPGLTRRREEESQKCLGLD